MKSFVAVLALVALVSADVSHILKDENKAEVLKQASDVQPDKFSYSFETSNGIFGQETGQLKQVDKDQFGIEVQGSNGYTAPDGQQIQIQYVANENGYQPQGAHLPTPPAPEPIPDYILRAIEYIRTHPPKQE